MKPRLRDVPSFCQLLINAVTGEMDSKSPVTRLTRSYRASKAIRVVGSGKPQKMDSVLVAEERTGSHHLPYQTLRRYSLKRVACFALRNISMVKTSAAPNIPSALK